jgi:tRNA A-37 threonylcarbamoyl transferase component Bud32
MTNLHHLEDVNGKNEKSLQTLVRAIRLSQGEFSLILVRCNYANLRAQIVQRLHEISPVRIREITLPVSAKTLYTSILTQLGDEHPSALMVLGLESVTEIDRVLTSSKYVREEFRKNFPFPMLLWVNDLVLQKLNRLATDFANWATRVEFTLSTDELAQFLRQKTDEIFASDTHPASEACWELETARQELQNRGQVIERSIQASLEFAAGLNYYLYDQIEAALEHYHPSLAFWQQSNHLERQGILLVHIAFAYDRKAEQNYAENYSYWEESRNYLQQCLDIFEQAQRPDLVAKYISKLGEVLRRLQQWGELQSIAQESLKLHQNDDSLQQLAQDYGFLAEVALAQSHWNEANQLAQQALEVLANIPNLKTCNGLYRFILARSQEHLGQIPKAICNLETAIAESNSQHDPQLYISILEKLRWLYFEQGEYLEAFYVKQKQRQIEHKYAFRAFVGVGYLTPQQKLINHVAPLIENQRKLPQTIHVPGREKDVETLIKRISSTEHKLIVIHGQSGVGKTSILQAGLIPALQQQVIGERNALPVMLQVYTNWIETLGHRLAEAYEEVGSYKLSFVNLDSVEAIFKQLRKNVDRNLITILIFDQLEEFFFVYTNKVARLSFYKFLRVCLDIPFVKVILSLREDYLHYLLEWEPMLDIPAINNDILIKQNRYHLTNLSKQDAKDIIVKLTEKSHFFLEPLFIDELVEDLASETGEVRPIELQIVGAQLQTDKITSRDKYDKFGGKKKLVQLFLEEVLKDCGSGNESAAESVLYLLTNTNGTRPIKTYAELKADLASESNKLDLVLEILVKSGLVSLRPESYGKSYQLVHDYLVGLIRQKIERPIKEQILYSKLLPKISEKESHIPQTQVLDITSLQQTSPPTVLQQTSPPTVTFQEYRKTKLLLNPLAKLTKIIKISVIAFNRTLNYVLNRTGSLIAIFSLIILLLLPSSQEQLALKILVFGGGIAAYTLYQTKKQKDKLISQIEEQRETISLLQKLIREGGSSATEIPTELHDKLDTDRLLNRRYKIKRRLGSGGFSYTYLAEDTHRPGNPVCVVKHLQPARHDEVFLEVARRLFKTEAEILEIVGEHEQIPQLMAYFEENQQFYIVQEYIQGHSIQEELIPGQPKSEDEVIDFLKDILPVLVFIHRHNVIHRDIKPSNFIRRERDQHIVLIDFGAVKQIQPQVENLTVAVGTVGYAPPEQFMGQPTINSDIYALGMIAIQALTGTLAQQLERDPNTLALIWRHLAQTTEELATVLDKMVAYNYLDRYRSAEEVLRALNIIPPPALIVK